MQDVRYYIKHPNGRTRINAKTDEDAREKFDEHWTASARWASANPTRQLVKETREVIVTAEAIKATLK